MVVSRVGGYGFRIKPGMTVGIGITVVLASLWWGWQRCCNDGGVVLEQMNPYLARSGPLRGSFMLNSAPLPGLLCTVMVPL